MRPERPAARWLVWLAIMLMGTTAAAAQPAPKEALWRVTVRQIDAQGAQVGKPSDFTCPRSGCEQAIQLEIHGKPYQFLVAITVVPAGAYVALQSLTPEVKGVFGFEQGYVGPVFVRLLQGRRVSSTLRYILTGPAIASSEQGVQLMPTENSLVFHRKLQPDLVLKVAMDLGDAGGAPPPKPPSQ